MRPRSASLNSVLSDTPGIFQFARRLPALCGMASVLPYLMALPLCLLFAQTAWADTASDYSNLALLSPVSTFATEHSLTHKYFVKVKQMPLRASAALRLGVVITDLATIRSGRQENAKLLTICPKGLRVGIIGASSLYYAVLMANHSCGFIAKKSVKLLPYQAVPERPQHPGGKGELPTNLVPAALQYLSLSFTRSHDMNYSVDGSRIAHSVKS